MTLTNQLKQARECASMTQNDVFQMTGIKTTTLSNWENGISRPDVENLALLCHLYHISPNVMLEYAPDNTPLPDPREIEIGRIYNDCNEDGKTAIHDHALFVDSQPRYKKSNSVKQMERKMK
jgi:transcriptional regulator with XRE-family HTH domain